MRGIEFLTELVKTPNGQAQLIEWSRSTITAGVIEAVQDRIGAANIAPGISTETGLIELGRVSGVQSFVQLVRDPISFLQLPTPEAEARMQERRKVLMNPSYGSADILERERLGLTPQQEQ